MHAVISERGTSSVSDEVPGQTQLLKSKLECHRCQFLSADDCDLLKELPTPLVQFLLTRHPPEDNAIAQWIDAHKGQFYRDDLQQFLMRLMGLWAVVMTGRFLLERSMAPNVISRAESVVDGVFYFSFGLPVLWRFNDVCIRSLRMGYRRLTDVPDSHLGDVVELLSRRYLFACMVVLSSLSLLSRTCSDANHVLILEYLCFLSLLANLLPALYQDFLYLIDSDSHAIYQSPMVSSIYEVIRSMRGMYQLVSQGVTCLRNDGHFRGLVKVPHDTPDQMWLFCRLVIYAVAALPPSITSKRLDRLVFSGENRAPSATTALSAKDMLWIGLNASDGRILFGLLDSLEASSYGSRYVSNGQKYQLLDRGIHVMLERPDFLPLLYRAAFKRYFLDEARLQQFGHRFMQYLMHDERLRNRVVQCFDLFCLHDPSPCIVENSVRQILRSDLLDDYPQIYDKRVVTFILRSVSDLSLLMVLIRDLARVLVWSYDNDRVQPIIETVYMLSLVLESLSHVTWSESQDAQADIAMIFTNLSLYFSDIDCSVADGCNFRQALSQLASLSDCECVEQSATFYWAIFHLVNTICHSAGVIEGISTPGFKHFLSNQLFIRFDDRLMAFIEQVVGQQKTVTKPELIMNFIDTLCSALQHDLLGAFQKSFQSSVEFNDFLRIGVSHPSDLKDMLILKSSSKFLETILRFIDHVDRVGDKQSSQMTTHGPGRHAHAKDRSIICCLALLFDYFGEGRLYGSSYLANLMYRNVFSNFAHLRWCLMIIEVFLSSIDISSASFSPQYRRALPANCSRLARSLYHVITRSLFHLPRFVLSLCQIVLIALATILYNLGQEKVLLIATALVGAVLIVQALLWPMILVPIVTVLLFYGYTALMALVEPYIKHHVDVPDHGSVSSSDAEARVSQAIAPQVPYALPIASSVETYDSILSSVNSDKSTAVGTSVGSSLSDQSAEAAFVFWGPQ